MVAWHYCLRGLGNVLAGLYNASTDEADKARTRHGRYLYGVIASRNTKHLNF